MAEGTRYAQLIALVPRGSFYRSRGAVVPLRGRGQPYEFLLTAPEGAPALPAGREYSVSVNGSPVATITTDGNGEATVEIEFIQGPNTVEFIDAVTGDRLRSYVTARAYATLMAAHAEVIEGIDAGIEAARTGTALESASSDYLSSPHGALVAQGPLAAYSAAPNDASYRMMLRWLRQAYRVYGASLRGLRQAVAPYTSTLPLRVPKDWRKTWRLGVDLMPNGRLETYTRQLDEAYTNELREPFPTLNADSYLYVMAAEAQTAGASSFAGPFTDPPVPQRLVVVITTATWDPANLITITGTGGSGEDLSEVFDPADAVVLDGTRSAIVGTQTFVTVTAAEQSGGAGVATASIGLFESRFVRLVGDGLDSYHSVGESLPLLHSLVAAALSWADGEIVYIPAEAGRLVLPRKPTFARFYGLVSTATAATAITLTDDERYLLLEADDRGPVLVDLGGAGGWPTPSLTQVATQVNAVFNADVRYGTGYDPIAQAVSGPGTLSALALYTSAPDADLLSLVLHPVGPDAAPKVLGLPRNSTTASAAITVPGTVLVLTNGFRLPERVDLFVGTVGDTTATPVASTFAPASPGAIEVVFEAGCRLTALVVTGTDLEGNTVQETFTRPDSLVDSGTANAQSASGTVVTIAGAFSGVEPAMFFRWTSGPSADTGAIVRAVDLLGVNLATLSSVGVVPPNESWEVHRQTRVEGVTVFATVTELLAVGPSGVGTIRAATAFAAGAEGRGYRVRVGRGLSKSAAAPATVTFADTASTSVALFAALTAPEGFDAMDVGGWVLISGSGSTNNGLHEVVAIETGNETGYNALLLRHQDAPTGTFTAGADAAVAWRLYTRGEVATVIQRTFAAPNTPRLYPPGVLFDHPANSAGVFPLVELDDELPLRVEAEVAGALTVDVDPALAQTTGGPYVDTVTVAAGSRLPDGWEGTGFSLPAAAVTAYPGYLDPSRLVLSVFFGGAPVTLSRSAGPEVTSAYRGFVVRALAWVQSHLSATADFTLEFSPDGGSTWDAGTVPPDTVSGEAAAAYPQPVTRTVLSATPADGGTLDPVLVAAQYEVPYDATDLWVRLTVTTAGGDTGLCISLERFQLVAVPNLTVREAVTGLALSASTVALSEHRAKFGELLYVWPHARLAGEDSGATAVALGLPEAGTPDSQVAPGLRGTIDRVVNAHGVWDRYDVGEYGTAPGYAPVNVVGAYDDLGWLAATLTNLEVVPGVPARASYLRPTAASLAEETLAAGTGPVYTLDEDSRHASFPDRADTDAGELLLEDGVPVPAEPEVTWTQFAEAAAVFSTPLAGLQTVSGLANPPPAYLVGRTLHVSAATNPANIGRFLVTAVGATDITFENAGGAAAGAGAATLEYAVEGADPWTFTAVDEVTIDAAEYDADAVYTVRYERPLTATTDTLDLGASFADYLWLVDAAVRTREEAESRSYERTEQLLFSQTQAKLSVRSDEDQSAATLTKTDSVSTRTLPYTAWRFVDASTVEVTAQEFDPDAVYALTYQGVVPAYPVHVEVTLETRSSAVSEADVLLQSWREVEVDEVVDRTHRYHQLRVSIRGVVDVRDVEVLGLGLRGLHLSGADAYAPGIV